MSFKVRVLNESDYDKLLLWWKANRFPAPPKDALPENGIGGIMIQKNGIDICAGFLYFTNSKIVWLEYIVADFNYREADRTEAIRTVIAELCGVAKRKGFKYVFTSVKNDNLVNRFEEVGFVKGKNNTTEMVISL